MMEDRTWIQQFLSFEGNEFFCEVDDDFIVDRFNLTGITTGPERMQDIINLVTGPATDYSEHVTEEQNEEEDSREAIAQRFYGLVHARFILSTRGIQKMLAKFTSADFGRCPRALCRQQPVLPIGLHDLPDISEVKLYCPKCEDIYHPTSMRQAALDSAYFGTSFPAMLFQVYPKHLPRRSNEQFTLKVFGFKLHEHAQLARWQQKRREEIDRQVRLT